MVIVQDVNDNAPRLIEDYQPVILEHIPPTKVAEIFATDDDDKLKNNGPPFTFRIDPNASSIIHASFKVECEQTDTQGDGMAVLSSLRSFDRELQKQYIIPIIIKDSGNPPMSGTSTLTITIGDINDNMMLPGSKDIFVYNFMGQAPDTEIGRVYVYDLDDWDIPDKTFHWETTEHPLFQLNPSTGMITMRQGTHNGRYKLKFRVYDHKHNQADIQANVTITVQNISEEHIESSASIRIAGLSDEDFIRTWNDMTNTHTVSKLNRLQKKVADLLKISREAIIVYSVQLHSRSPPVTDVRLAVHGSNKYKSFVLNGLIAMHRSEIEKEVGINITMVGINECLYETLNCEGSCTNNVSVDKSLHLVNANRTALVGVKIHVTPECTCAVHKFIMTEKCHKSFCFNGGRCIDTRFGPKCSCSSEFSGPRCQQTSRNFQGNSWAWYPALEVCGNSHLSLEFRTKYKAGLLLYNGPLTSPDVNETLLSDFISLELIDGMPRLLIDFGSGTLELKIVPRKELNDEEWHRIDVFWDTESVRMVLDFCKSADIVEQEDGSLSKFDYTVCQAEGVVPPFSEYLNVNDPLQIGGCHRKEFDPHMFHWHGAPFTKSFNGCIRNVYYNRQLLDLGSSGFSNSNRGSCPSQRHRSSCSIGHSGARCTGSVLPTSFAPGSYIKYVLSFEPNSFSTDLHLRFRTREVNGELFRASDKHGHEYAVLEINESKIHFFYNLNSFQPEEKDLWLSNITVSDGQWHTVKVTRYGSVSILMLDDGEGLRYNESFKFSGHQLLVVDRQEGVYVGGKAEYTGVQTFEVHNDYQKGCMEDIKLEGKQLPLPPAVNGTQWGQATMAKNLGYKCFSNGPCINIVCPEPFVCVDLWNEYECACGEGRILSQYGNACIDHNECLNMPCLNGGTCINQEPDLRYSCVCPKRYGGANCEILQEELTIRLSTDAVVAFFVCILVILLLIFILIVYNAICKEDIQKKKEEDCVGENIIKYDDEGGGKDSMMESDLTNVQVDGKKSMDASTETLSKCPSDTEPHVPPSNKDTSYTSSLMASADDLHNFIHEGSGSVAGSLSSLASGTEEGDQEFDFLSKWGPKFHKLAHSYRHKSTESEEEGQQEIFMECQQKSLSNMSYNS